MKRIIGNATLYLGDCLKILPTLNKVDAVVTDPPYGVNLKGKKGRKGIVPTAETFYYPDEPEDIKKLIGQVMPLIFAVADRSLITSGSAMMPYYPPPDAFGVIWQPNGTGFNSWGFNCAHPILYYGKCPYQSNGGGTRPTSTGLIHPGGHVTGENQIEHPCPKPIIWMNWLVNRGSLPNETVLDLLMGSGTTGVACMNLGRKFIGIEIEPKYFDVACERIEQAQKQGRLFA